MIRANEEQLDERVPQLRTSRAPVIATCVATLLALLVALTVGGGIDETLGSEALAIGVLGAWCFSGALAAIVGIVDAYTRPAGELLGVVFSVAATIFSILGLIVAVALLFTVGESVFVDLGS